MSKRLNTIALEHKNSSLSAYIDLISKHMDGQPLVGESQLHSMLENINYKGIFKEAEFASVASPEVMPIRAKLLANCFDSITQKGLMRPISSNIDDSSQSNEKL
jgi:hypothetical protein